MKKLASDKVAATLSQVGPTLRALSEENQTLKEKVAAFQKRDRVEKIATHMEAKELDPSSSREEKVAALSEQTDLDVVEKAIELSAPQIKLASVSDSPGNPSSASDAFAVGLMDD
jgi:hypothetical protein